MGTSVSPHAIVVGLGFGDEGKGALVDWLANQTSSAPSAVVRFNGGAQAGHNVVLADGHHHTFSQFGAATLRGIPTYLSRFMMVEPLALAAEASHLARIGVADPFALVSVDRRALLTTPIHAAANQAREAGRGVGAHGTCGRGIGETMVYARAAGADAPVVADTQDPALLRRKLARLEDFYATEFGRSLPKTDLDALLEAYAGFARVVTITDETHLTRLVASGQVLFEGAQGVLLDADHGFHPHTTWSTTTFANALMLLAEAGADPNAARRIGVMRSYTTRHGAGPFPTEDPGLAGALREAHNGDAGAQGAWRVGHLDLVLARYAAEVARPTEIALTHLDRASTPGLRVAAAYEQFDRLSVPSDRAAQERLTATLLTARPVLGAYPESIEATIANVCQSPVTITAAGPTTYRSRR